MPVGDLNRAAPSFTGYSGAAAYNRTVRRTLLLFGFVFALTSFALARDPREEARIDFLLHEVETSHGVVFIRNTEYDAAAAVSHLRMKLRFAGGRVETAEEFIKYCASESSITHQKYKVRLANRKTVDAADYFTEKLRAFDRQKR